MTHAREGQRQTKRKRQTSARQERLSEHPAKPREKVRCGSPTFGAARDSNG